MTVILELYPYCAASHKRVRFLNPPSSPQQTPLHTGTYCVVPLAAAARSQLLSTLTALCPSHAGHKACGLCQSHGQLSILLLTTQQVQAGAALSSSVDNLGLGDTGQGFVDFGFLWLLFLSFLLGFLLLGSVDLCALLWSQR